MKKKAARFGETLQEQACKGEERRCRRVVATTTAIPGFSRIWSAGFGSGTSTTTTSSCFSSSTALNSTFWVARLAEETGHMLTTARTADGKKGCRSGYIHRLLFSRLWYLGGWLQRGFFLLIWGHNGLQGIVKGQPTALVPLSLCIMSREPRMPGLQVFGFAQSCILLVQRQPMIQKKRSKPRHPPFHASPSLACCHSGLLKLSGMSPPDQYATNLNISITLTNAVKVSNSCGKKKDLSLKESYAI